MKIFMGYWRGKELWDESSCHICIDFGKLKRRVYLDKLSKSVKKKLFFNELAISA